MFKRLISFCLTVSMLGTIAFSASNTTAYAEELPSNLAGIEQSFSPGDYSPQGTNELSEFNLPNNPPQVNMVDSQQLSDKPSLSKARSITATNTTATDTQRYTVLVLDTSASSSFLDSSGSVFYTADTAVEYVKTSAKKFIEGVHSANGTNYIAIVTYKGATATVVSAFSDDLAALTASIDSIYASQNTRNVAAGLQAADSLISQISEPTAVKNVVLFTTGMTNDGGYNYNGHYNESTVASNWRRTDTGVRLYAYANVAYSAAESLKSKSTVYTIGLFQTMGNMPELGRPVVEFFKLCASELPTSLNYFYDVKDINDLDFVFGEVANNIVKKTGTFKYPGEGRDYSSTYYYDDAYFYKSSYEYDEHLATMSLCFELSAWGSEEVGNDYSLKMKNAEELLGDIGFIDFDHNYTDFSNNGVVGKPTKDSIGAVAAHKRTTVKGEDYTLIALAVRGGGYESEWAGNFTIGASGEHEGFSKARDQVITFLQNYISEKGITGKIKLWITGYSRAAATANMVAGKIDEERVSFSGCTLELSDLYAYTFETPAGALDTDTKSKVFDNIFNIINPNDPVPKVAPATWHFTRYGKDQPIPSAADGSEKTYKDSLEKMLNCYYSLEGTESYDVGKFSMKKIDFNGWALLPGGKPAVSIVDDTKNAQSQDVFLNSYITMLAKDFLKDRPTYVSNYQNGIRDACSLFFGASKMQSEKLIEVAKEKFSSNWGWIAYEFLKPNLNPWGNNEKDAYEKVAEYLRESLNEAGITDYSQTEFDNAVVTILDLVVAVMANHPNLASTMVMNISGIGQAHFPDLCLAWMQSMDSYYTPDGAEGFTSGKYRVVRINCPVDVKVYNDERQLVASIIGDVPQGVSSIVSAINEDGEKLVFLPASDDYTVEITATGDGTMTYEINEYNPKAGEINRLVNYYDVPILNAQVFTGLVPAYKASDLIETTEAASNTVYTLATDRGEIKSSDDLSGESATNAYFTIDAIANDKSLGMVQGSGTRQLGTFSKLTAIPYPNSDFLGWYKDGTTKVSNDLEYRFRVVNDVNLVAKFESNIATSISVTSVNLSETTCTLEVGSTHTLIATVNPPDASNKDVIWSSSDTSIITVDSTGKVKAINAGTAVITVTTVDGNKTATCNITVTNPIILAESVSLNKTTDTFRVGDTDTLVATVNPTDASNKAVTWSSSDTSIVAVDSTGKVKAINAGTAVITVTTVDGNKTATCNITVTNPIILAESTPQIPVVTVQRLAGLNRIETSIAIAKEQYADSAPDAIVLATASNFADDLAGSGLAYKYNAPLLLVNKTVSNSKTVLEYISTNLSKSKTIYILGGTGAVSSEISDYLTTNGYNIIRLGGKDRYETNQKIVDYLNIPKGTSIVITTGSSFADALSISSIADIKGYPILLNGKDNLLASVSSDITNIQPTTVYIIGGTGVLSTNIETQIKLLNANITIVRLGGKDRYETSMKIIEYFNLTTDTITVATGIDFPDALSGSVLAARKNCSVLLVDNKDITKQKELLNKQKITNVIVFGGEGVISNAIANSLVQK